MWNCSNPTMEPMDQVIASVLEEHAELTGEAYIRQEPTQCSPKLMELGERLCRGPRHPLSATCSAALVMI